MSNASSSSLRARAVVDQVFDQIEYLRRDGDGLRSAMEFAPVGVECVVLEEIAQLALPLSGLRSSSALRQRLEGKE